MTTAFQHVYQTYPDVDVTSGYSGPNIPSIKISIFKYSFRPFFSGKDYRDSNSSVSGHSTSLAEEPKCFVAHFEIPPPTHSHTPVTTLQALFVQGHIEEALQSRKPSSCWSRWSTWKSTQCLCLRTGWSLHPHLQPVPRTSHRPTMPQISHHHSHPKEVNYRQPG